MIARAAGQGCQPRLAAPTQDALEAAGLGNMTQAVQEVWAPALNSSAAAPQLLANDLAAFMRGGGALARRRLQAGLPGLVLIDPRVLEPVTNKVRAGLAGALM